MNLERTYGKVKKALKNTAIAYAVVGSIYGYTMSITGNTSGYVSADRTLGLEQPHAQLWRFAVGRTLEDVITALVDKKSESNDK